MNADLDQKALAPCPFCGSEHVHAESDGSAFFPWFVHCPNGTCPASEKMARSETRGEAIAAWNKRPLFSRAWLLRQLASGDAPDVIGGAAPAPSAREEGREPAGLSSITVQVNGIPLVVDTSYFASTGRPFLGIYLRARIPEFDNSYTILMLAEGAEDVVVTDDTPLPLKDGLRFVTVPPALGA